MNSKRATRAHPSPSGYKSLSDPPPRKPRGKKAAKSNEEHIEESQEERVDAAATKPQTRSKRNRATSKEAEEPKPKRARGGRSTKTKKQTQNDSSSDADLVVPGYFPSNTPYNENHDGSEPEAEVEMDEQRSTPTQAQTAAASSIHRRQFLSPKSPKPTPKSAPKSSPELAEAKPALQAEPITAIKSKTTALETTDPKSAEIKDKESEKPERYLMSLSERELVFEKKYGYKMPKPKPKPFKSNKLAGFVNDSVNIYGAAMHLSDDEEEDRDEFLDEEYMDGPSFTYQQLDAYRNSPDFRRKNLPFNIPPQSTDSAQIRRKLAEQAARDKFQEARDRVNAGIFAPTRLSRPIGAIRVLQKRIEEDNQVPTTTQEMEAILDNYYKKSTMRSPQQHAVDSTLNPTTTRERFEQPETPYQEFTVSEEDDITNDGQASEISEVHQEILAPETPRPATSRPQESRIWNGFSAVKSIMSTPLKYFRGRSQAAETTNEAPVTGDFTFRHPHNPPPIPRSHHTTTPHRSATHRGAHTERRRRAATPHHRGPQTERRRRREDEEKPPMHLRGVLTEDEVKERHRRQDREKAKQRATREALEEEVDEDAEDYMMQTTPTIKRKRPQPQPQTHITPDNLRGMFCAPSTVSSDSSDEEEDEVQSDVQRQRENERREQYLGEQSETPLYHKTVDTMNAPAASESLGSKPYQRLHDPDWMTGVLARNPAKPMRYMNGRYIDTEGPHPFLKFGPENPHTLKREERQRLLEAEEAACEAAGEPYPIYTYVPTKASRPIKPLKTAGAASTANSTVTNGTEGGNQANKTETQQAPAREPGPLEPKQWTQTPPPKPRPSNAQLPQQQAQPAEPAKQAEPVEPETPKQQAQPSAAERLTATALKHKPIKPSGLRNMTQMSPLEQVREGEKENMTQMSSLERVREGEKENMTQMLPLEQVREGEKENMTAADVERLMAKVNEEDVDRIDKSVWDFVDAMDEKEFSELTEEYLRGFRQRYEEVHGPNCWQRTEADIATDAYF